MKRSNLHRKKFYTVGLIPRGPVSGEGFDEVTFVDAVRLVSDTSVEYC